VETVPDPLILMKSGSAGKRNQISGSVAIISTTGPQRQERKTKKRREMEEERREEKDSESLTCNLYCEYMQYMLSNIIQIKQ
jgi:hypothetical protein